MENQKKIPTVDGEFRPSMADISRMLDATQDSQDDNIKYIHDRVEDHLFGLWDLYKLFTNYDEAKSLKAQKEKEEISKEIELDQKSAVLTPSNLGEITLSQ